MKTKIERIEALRGFVAVYIVIHHTLPHYYFLGGVNVANLNRLGQEAVMLFFLLSGFVIKLAFESSPRRDFGTYFSKRFYRIYVPLVIVLALGYLSRCYSAGAWISPRPLQLLGNLFMLQDYADVKPNVWVGTYFLNDPLWSLAYEWWFYMLFFPLTVCIRDENSRDNIVFLTCVLATVVHYYLPVFPVRVFMYLGIWWSGVYVAQRWRSGRLEGLSDLAKPLIALAAGSAVLAVNVVDKLPELGPQTPGFYPWLPLRHLVFAFLALIVGFYWRRMGWPLFNTIVRPFVFFAPMSYALYISHEYLFTSATYLGFIDNRVVRWCLYFTIVVVISWVIERVIYPWVTRRLTKPSARSSTL